MNHIPRNDYLQFLNQAKDKQIIKVLSGVRRAGKSTIMQMFREQLIQEGVSEPHILTLNFEEYDQRHLLDPVALHAYVMNFLKDDQMHYVFLDEIQMVADFERVVDSLFIRENIDLYITGSNAYFLSGELATMLTGRYLEKKVYPLSFKEFVSVDPSRTLIANYTEYLKSSFPFATNFDSDAEVLNYTEGIYNTVILKDIVSRLDIRDAATLDRIVRTLFSSIGSPISIMKITNTLVSAQYKISNKTVEKYVQGIVDSMLMYRVSRYDLKGRKILASIDKYYAVDMGLRGFAVKNEVGDYGHILENVIYLELRRRGYNVYVGKMGDLEVDFVAISAGDQRQYIQVALNTLDETTLQRELRSLQAIHDDYPKLLLTLDDFEPQADFNGITKMNALEWLMLEA
ncbi:MAG: ATP-binding protein [Lactobacillaceae bacterium]|jgi:predicted AAA+ superfamily ATPase|nr:ATP-binding protein [Lactobacillaceae bacterium]